MLKTRFILILALATFRLLAQPALPTTNQMLTPIANPYSGSWIYYATNAASGLDFLNGASIPYVMAVSNSLAALTAGATNGLATVAYVNAATNGFVTASVTNGLATTNFVTSQGYVTIAITNGLATVSYVNTATNDLVTAAVTNGLATTNYVTNAIATAKSIQATNLASGGSLVGQVLTATSSGSNWSNAPTSSTFTTCWAGTSANATIAANSTHYASPNNTSTISATTDASAGTRVPVTRSITLTNLYVIVSAVVTATDTLTIMTNGVATPITVSITGASQKTGNDTTDSATIAAGTEIGVKIVTASGSAAVKWAWSFEGH